jgi:hypothetical protein
MYERYCCEGRGASVLFANVGRLSLKGYAVVSG